MKNVHKLKLIIILMILIILFIILIPVMVISSGNKTYKILVDVEYSKLYLFEDNILIKEYSCSGGKWSTPSPIGTWSIVSKAKWGEGFGGSWLGLNVPWGQFGIHGTLDTYSVGWASSHGCIRMNNNEVSELYKIVPIGTKVIIIDGVYGDFGKSLRNLKSGMYGSDVMQIQKRLKELGFFNGTPNGKFGSQTEEAVKKFCRANGLYETKVISTSLIEKMGFILMD